MRPLLLLIALSTSASCLRQTAFHCDTDADCGAGTCEAVGYCSFADAECPDGRRFGDLSGPHAGKCIGETDMPDAAGDLDAPLIDAMIDAPPNLDTDSDGVLNANDNCQTIANTNQFNEDGDALGDACDPCPVSTNNADGDADGVGDACDPRPATAGDAIVLFEGFHNGTPPGWEAIGTWTAQLATHEITGVGPPGSYGLLNTTLPATGQETVSASVTPTIQNGAINSAGVVSNRMVGASQIVCTLYRSQGAEGLSVYDATNLAGAVSMTYEMMLNQTYVVRLRRESPNYTCNATRAATTATVMRTSAAVQNPFNLGLAVSGATARYQWLMVVRNP